MPKNVLPSFKILTAADLSGDLTSLVTHIGNLDNIGIQCVLTTSDAAGTLAVQVSADHQQDTYGNVTVAGHWVTITHQDVAAGQPSDTMFDLNQLSAPWIRLAWTRTGGTGTITATITGKAA